MANLGALNKAIRFQKLLLPLNAHASLHASASTVLLQHQSERSQRQRRETPTLLQSQQRRHYCSVGKKITFGAAAGAHYSTTVDDFRAREEQREQEFNRQQEESEKNKQTDAEEEAKRAKVDAIRAKILAAALPHVPTLGWTRKALVQGAEDAGLPSVTHGMFPEGGFALVSYFYGKCNDELIERLRAETQNGQQAVADPLEFLVRAVRMRLEMIVPYKGQWPQALALIALPQNASTALAQVLTLVDDICYYSGDRSVDFGWYTRRIGLATIMKMTELYMLQDTSPQHAKTWDFLKNRMDEAVQLQMVLMQTENMTHSFQRSFNSAFITARNILGLDYARR